MSLIESFWSSNSFSSSALLQPLVRLVVELLAVDRQGADVVHDLAAEVVLAAFGDVDLLLDRPHQPLVRLFVLAGEGVLHLLALRVGLDVVDVVAAQPGQGRLVGGDRPLHFVLHDVGVLLLHDAQQLAVLLLGLLVVDEAVVLEPRLQFVEHHERVDRPGLGVGHQGVGNLVLHVAGRDADQPFVVRLLAQLLDVLLGEAGQRLAVVQLQLLQPAEARVLRLLEPRENRPHRRHLDRVRGDVLVGTVLGL